CRKKIRKAERLGVEVCWSEDPKDWQRHYELLSALCHTQERLPPNSRQFYDGLRKLPRERVALAVSRYKGNIIAAEGYGLYKDTVYCLNEASLHSFRHAAPNDAKHWEGMKLYMKSGYRYYDIGQAPTPGLAQYKKNFGGKETTYFVLERPSSRLVYWLRRHY